MSTDDQKDPTSEVEAAMASIATTDELLERLLVLRDAVEVAALLDPVEANRQARQRKVGTLTHRLARAKTATAKQRDELGVELSRTESTVRQAFTAASLEQLVATFSGEGLAPVTVDRVCRLLLGAAASPAVALRLEQIAFTQLVRRAPSGELALLEDDAITARLERLGLVRIAPAEVRKATLQFYGEALSQLRALTTLEELYASPVVGRVAGLRYALRQDALDPALLHGSLEFELELRALADRFTQGRPANRLAYERARTRAEAEARDSVDAANAPEKAREFDRATGLRRILPVGLVRFYDGTQQRPGAKLTPYLVVIALLGGLLVWALMPSGDKRHELDPGELEELSALLVKGTVLSTAEGDAFFGEVDPEKWDALEHEQREHEAGEAAASFAAHKIHHGVARAGNKLAFQFDGGTATVPR